MAWTVASRWVSPPKWGGSAGTMKGRKARVVVTGTSDAASDLTDQVAIDISNLNNMRGDVCSQIAINRVAYDIATLTSLAFQFDHGTDDQFLLIGNGTNVLEFAAPISDTLTNADGTGDLVITTLGGANGSRFMLDIEFTIK